jgi:O-antigen ligase/polysaccharide polymerase Wzy-like membrane protein
MAAEGDEGLNRPSFAMPTLGVAIAVAAAGMAAGLVLFATLRTVGPPGVIAPALAVGVLILFRFPAMALALLLGGVVLFEPVDPGLLPTFNSFYVVIRASLTPVDVLLFIGLGGLLLRFATEGRRPRLPEPLTGPLALLGLATVAGVITGYTAHADVSNGELYHRAMNDVYLIFVPLLVVNVLRDSGALRAFVVAAAMLAAFKGLSGAYSAFGGTGSQLTEETISYLEPVPNLIMLTLVLGSVAALVRGLRLPAWIIAGAPLALLGLLLSYRRSFWIAAAFTLIVVVIVASRHRGRAVLMVGGVALVLTFATVLTVGSSGPTTTPLIKRAQQLSPAGIEANRGDRYRTDERRNVIANIEEHPLTGIGLGVPWKVHYPLAESHDRRYVHLALLWFWLSFGPLGAIAYLVLMGAALWIAATIWRRHPDPIVQIGAIAAFGTILAVLVVELTATFTGIEPRFSIVLGAGLGWLAAAWRDLPPRDRPSPSAP